MTEKMNEENNKQRERKKKGEHVRGINLSLSMAQMLLKQRADRAPLNQSLGERKEEKNKDCCCADDVSLVHAQSDTCS